MSDVAVLELGPNNMGSLGADTLPPEQATTFRTAYEDQENRLHDLENVYYCMDGRNEFGAFGQVLGGIAILETYGDLMLSQPAADNPEQRVSTLVKNNTVNAIADGIGVTVHGDTHKKEEGCAANAAMETVLHYGAEQIDIIAPRAWNVGRQFGLDKVLHEDDVTTMILTGKQSADTKEIWDVDATGRAKIIVENGGSYVELKGNHGEIDSVMELNEDETIDRSKIAELFTSEAGEAAQIFMATMGKYAKDTFERARKHGMSERDAALKVMSAIVVHLSAFKILGNDSMDATLVGTPYQVSAQ